MIPTQPGIYRGVTEDEYNEIPAVRRSFLWTLYNQSPMIANYQQENPKDAEHFRDGWMVHAFVLEPREFLQRYERLPSFELDEANVTKDGKVPKKLKATGYYKAKVQEFETRAKEQGKEIVSYDSYDMAYGIGQNILNSPIGKRLFDRGPASEAVAVWKDADTDLLCKARYDCLVEGDMATAADIKTTRDLNVFESQVRMHGYYFQAAFYLQGLRANRIDANFLFIPCEKTPPYEVATPYQMGPQSLALGDLHITKALAQYKHCIENKSWPARGGAGIRVLELGEWDLKELEKGGVG